LGDRPAERPIRLSRLEAFFSSGRAVDLVLVVMAAEAIWLVAGRRWPAGDAFIALLPGALLLLALRGALTGAAWPWIAAALAASFPAHLADLARRRRG
jgi:hypothetical protein